MKANERVNSYIKNQQNQNGNRQQSQPRQAQQLKSTVSLQSRLEFRQKQRQAVRPNAAKNNTNRIALQTARKNVQKAKQLLAARRKTLTNRLVIIICSKKSCV
jgi:hypothetical protein